MKMYEDKKKRFETPEAEIVKFDNEDIIVTSLEDDFGNTGGDSGDIL